MKRSGAALATAVLLALGSGAAAQDEEQDAFAAELAGQWQIVPVDGGRACTVTLGLVPATGGWHAGPDAQCDSTAPASIGTAGWTFADGMRLLDANGATLMRFEEDETALPSSPNLAAPAYYIVPVIPGYERLRQPREWAGPWQFTAKGQRACVLQFGPPEQISAQDSGGTVTVRGCRDAGLRRMNRWYVEGMTLLLTGPGDQQIAFAPSSAAAHRSDDGRWRLTR